MNFENVWRFEVGNSSDFVCPAGNCVRAFKFMAVLSLALFDMLFMKFSTPTDWTRRGVFCYRLHAKISVTWDDADKLCRKYRFLFLQQLC